MERFGFRRLEVYKESMAMAKDVSRLMRAIPRDQMDLVWQVRRAARSVVLNVAEGAGEYAPREKARIYRIGRRSAWETVAGLDIALEEELLDPDAIRGVLDRLHRVIGMLTTMGKRAETRAPGAHSTTRQVKARKTKAARPPSKKNGHEH